MARMCRKPFIINTLNKHTLDMNRFSDYTARVEKLLGDMRYPGGALAGLYEPIAYSMSAGGKRLRPALALMTADAFNNASEQAERAAIGLEMFHNFTLLHDDVMDNSDTRRGRPSVHSKWDVNTAILSGDTMLSLATELMMNVPDEVLRKVLDAFNEMAIRVYEGQQLDMDFETAEDVSIDDYIRMITDKTGELLGASARIGALIAGASDEDASLMAQYGIMLGIAFQIQDDWLDVYGDSTTFGKQIGGDINNNKRSFLLLTALSTPGSEAEAIREAMKLPAGETKVKIITNLYNRIDISSKCKDAIAHYSSKALNALKSTSLAEDRREPFRQLVEKLTGRKR